MVWRIPLQVLKVSHEVFSLLFTLLLWPLPVSIYSMEHLTAPQSIKHKPQGNGNQSLNDLIDLHLAGICTGPFGELNLVDAGLAVMQVRASTLKNNELRYPMARDIVQFLVLAEGEATVRALDTEEEIHFNSRMMVQCSFPFAPWDLELSLSPDAVLWSVLFNLESLHGLFGSSFGSNRDDFEVFLKSYKLKKHFSTVENTPALNVVMFQIFNNTITEGLRKLYQKSKVTEFLTLYLNKPKKDNQLEASCPFVNDEEEIARIKMARSIVEEHLDHPPGLKELAKMVGTNEFKLKVGFKNLYGNTVFGYIGDLRMQKARELLEVKKMQVQDVAGMVGYTNSSHFIAAYKKKFGVTPKQYLKSAL